MLIRTASDLGKVIRAYRLHAGLSQQALADLVGTTQDWISGIERGRPRSELGLVLRTVVALKIPLDVPPPEFASQQALSARSDIPPADRDGPGARDADYPDIDTIADGAEPR